MVQITAHEDVKHLRREYDAPDAPGFKSIRTDYIFDKSQPNQGQAWLLDSTPNRVLRSHFHGCDQFQVIIGGEGSLGKHHMRPHVLHYSRAHTPYGPVIWGEKGMGLLTLRPYQDPYGQNQPMPDNKDKLAKVSGRKPWQTSTVVDYPQGELRPVPGFQDEYGLDCYAGKLAAGQSLPCPSPAHSNGQFILVMEGSLIYQGKEYTAFSVAYLTPDEAAFKLQAGSRGLSAMVLNFPPRTTVPLPAGFKAVEPRPGSAANAPAPAHAPARDGKAFQCELCAYVYDEALGAPEYGIAPGTRWEDVPHDWKCPDCSATKQDFTPLEF